MRVLHIIPDISASNGVLSMILNYARELKKENVVFDVLYFFDVENKKEDEILRLGGKIYKCDYPSIKRLINFNTINFFNDHKNEWKAIHIHGPHFAVFFAPYAKHAGYKNIFVHCHSSVYSLIGNGKINHFLSIYSRLFIRKRIACSEEAGKFWYRNKSYFVLNNAVNKEVYLFSNKRRAFKREELGINETSLVIGHIGKTDIPQKNHKFLLEIFSEIKKINSDSVLLLVGALPTDELDKLTERLMVDDSVFYLGARNDVPDLMQAFDVFLFPSISEGLPVSVIEAQFSSLPVVMSDSITNEVILRNQVIQLSLENNPSKWAAKVVELSKIERNNVAIGEEFSNWDITSESKKLIDMYMENI